VHKDNNNREQTVGPDSKATQDALITARMPDRIIGFALSIVRELPKSNDTVFTFLFVTTN